MGSLAFLVVIFVVTRVFSITALWTPIEELDHVMGIWLWDVRVSFKVYWVGGEKELATWTRRVESSEP